MNILVEQFPTAVLINGKEITINTDFRCALRVIMAFEDPGLALFEKQAVLLRNLYPIPPEDLRAAFEMGLKFLNCGKVSGDESAGPRVFSWAKDADLIYSAFSQTHGIDLETARLHWWKFVALFLDLGSETAFCQLTGLRKRVKTGKATKEEREAAAEMGDAFVIEELDTRTLAEKEAEIEFLRLVREGEKQHGVQKG